MRLEMQCACSCRKMQRNTRQFAVPLQLQFAPSFDAPYEERACKELACKALLVRFASSRFLQVTSPADIGKAKRIIFPGVGACGQALAALQAKVPCCTCVPVQDA